MVIFFKENLLNLSLSRHDDNYHFLSAFFLKKGKILQKTIKTNNFFNFLP